LAKLIEIGSEARPTQEIEMPKFYVLLSNKEWNGRDYEWEGLEAKTIEDARKEVAEIVQNGEPSIDTAIIVKHIEEVDLA
jgi:hypothetical protein